MLLEIPVRFAVPLRGAHFVDPRQPLVPMPTRAPAPPVIISPPVVQVEVPEEPEIDAEAERREADRARFVQLTQSLEQLGLDLRAQQQNRLAEMQKVAVEVAVAAAEHLLHQKIASGQFAVSQVVESLIARLGTSQAVTVHLHPDDLALLEAQSVEGTSLFTERGDLRLVADASLSRGDCRAETADLQIESRMAAQIAELRERLLEGLPEVQVERRRNRPTLHRYPDRRTA